MLPCIEIIDEMLRDVIFELFLFTKDFPTEIALHESVESKI
jgi:hypothetical protein